MTKENKQHLRAMGFVFAVGLLARGLHLAAIGGTPLYQMPHGDGRAYLEWADRLRAQGPLEGSEVWYQAPLYPFFLALVRSIAGESLLTIRIVQAGLGSLAAAGVCAAGCRVFGTRAGVAAGLLIALSSTSIWLDGLIQKSALGAALAGLALWLGTFSGPGARAGFGAAVGLLVLTRGEARLWLMACVAVLVIARQWRGAAAFAVGAILVLAPSLARNVIVAGSWTLSTSQGGTNLFIGNGPDATGVYRPLVPGRSDAVNEADDARRLAAQGLGRPEHDPLDPAEVSEYWRREALRTMSEDPAGAARLLGRKAALALNHVEVADTDDLGHAAESSPVLRLPITFRVIFVLALFGLLGVDRRRIHRAWPMVALAISQLGALVLFYVFARYRLPLTLALAPFAGAGLVGLRRVVPGRPLVSSALLAAGLTVTSIPLEDPASGHAAALVNEAVVLAELDRTEEAESALGRALALEPRNVGALRTQARLLMRAGRSAEARPLLEDLARGGAADWQLRAWLGMARAETGDLAGAKAPLESAALERPEALPIISNATAVAMASGDLRAVCRLAEARLAADDGPSSDPFRLQLAWIRATAEDPELRDGPRAVALTDGVSGGPEIVSVRAAALAEVGRFREAAGVIEGALETLGPGARGGDPRVQRLRAQGAAFARELPWRDAPSRPRSSEANQGSKR